MHTIAFHLLVSLAMAGTQTDQASMKVEVLNEAPPKALGAAIRDVLNARGYRIRDESGAPFLDIWLRKAIPSSAKPAGPKGTIQFPFFSEGELLGACQFAGEGHDYRDQEIPKGFYTLRYGLQPVNGDHLGVSPFRDYALLVPAAKDNSLALPSRKQLDERSAEAAGTSHPAVFMLLSSPAEELKKAPLMIHDSDKNTWSATLPLELAVKGQRGALAYPVRLVVVGVGPT
ncbi:MAG: hypothetical protein ACLQIB_31700 [Isosphaeraceae bacterium]